MKATVIPLIVLCATLAVTYSVPAYGQSESDERDEMVRIQNSLKLIRAFEHDSRHLYYLQANAIIADQGGWNEGELAYGTRADLLGEAAESLLLPKFKRLSSRLGNNKNLSDQEKTRLLEAVDQMLRAVYLSNSIAEALNASDLDLAIKLYHDQSVPLFEAVWATNYTLISEAERRFPRR